MRIDELKIKIVSLAFEAGAIHRDETKHRARARRFERYVREIEAGGHPPPKLRAVPTDLPIERMRRAIWHQQERRREAARLVGLFAYLDSQPETIRAELATRHGRQARGTFESLRTHRKGPVRDETRASLLAYGFLRGRDYHQLEAPNTVADDVPWEEARLIAHRFAEPERRAHIDAEFAEWRKWGEKYLADSEARPKRATG